MGKNKKKRKGKVGGAIPPPPPVRNAEDMTLEMFEATIGAAVRDVMTSPTMRKVISNAVHKATKEILSPQPTDGPTGPPKENG